MVTPKTPHALAVGEMIEEFRIARILGAGSFGIVYECENTYLPETAAIKEFLPPELAYRGADGRVTPLSDQTEETFNWARQRFLQEAKTLWELARPARHPNIVRVSRYCEANGTAYMFMEFEQGRSLSEILKTQGRLARQEIDVVFYPLLDGLERVHAAAVLHRDIKPGNVLIRADGSPVLIDFGAARRAVGSGERSVVSAFTPVYAALEQYHDVGDQGPWTDIYGLGATLYQAVTGKKPLSASERLCGGTQVPVAEECRGSYPQPILGAIDRALEIKPEDRPQSVAEWRRCLQATPLESAADAETVLIPVPRSANAEPAFVGAVSKGEAKEHRERGARVRLLTLVAATVFVASGVVLYYRDALIPLLRPQLPKPDLPISELPTPEPPITELPKPDQPITELPKPELPTTELPKPEKQPKPEHPGEPGARFSDPLASGGSGPTMVWLPEGEFQMGSAPGEADRNPDERLHLARVPKPFAVSETEITLGHYRRFIEKSGYRPRGSPCLRPDESWQALVEDWGLSWESPGYQVTDRHPVSCVSWDDAQSYARWLSQETGRRYRLPTELEWEYAARAGTASSRFWGDDPQTGCEYTNIAECGDNYIHAAPSGTFAPNAFQLHEMLGNLAEWTCSIYARGYSGLEAECGEGPQGTPRVFRGGSWLDAPALVRSAARDGAPANLRLNTIGFRLARTLGPGPGEDDTGADQVAERRQRAHKANE